jgi:hypothetical protein
MAVSGHLTLFVARSKGFFLKKPYPAPVMVWSALATKVIGTLLAAYGFGLITPIHWSEIALIWGYSIVWAFLTDWAKTNGVPALQSARPASRAVSGNGPSSPDTAFDAWRGSSVDDNFFKHPRLTGTALIFNEVSHQSWNRQAALWKPFGNAIILSDFIFRSYWCCCCA